MEEIMDKSKQTQSETKTRIPVWLYPSTVEGLDSMFASDNCKSRSEYIEKAIRFYNGYVKSEDATEFLAQTLAATIQKTMGSSENRIAGLLFRLAVEVSMMMNVLASGLEITDEELSRLRGKCVGDIKRTSGRITFDDAVKFQNGR
jgi:metal-responsive CopG/Arc/MetJ family transcriptional regulator